RLRWNGVLPPCRRDPASGSQQGKRFWATSRSSSFHRAHRAVRVLRVGNEYIVAELILSGGEIFLNTFALGDLIMALGITAENSRRFPGRGQNFRCRYFQVVMKND